MTEKNPELRPTAEEAQQMFDDLVKGKFKIVLRRRLTPSDPTWIGNTYRAIMSVKDEFAFQAKWILGRHPTLSKSTRPDDYCRSL